MGKQTIVSITMALGISLLVIFIISLAAAPVNAASSGKYGNENYDSYARGYKEGHHKGYVDGFNDGVNGKDPRVFIMIYYGPDSGYTGGHFNGYRDGYGKGYTAGKKLPVR